MRKTLVLTYSICAAVAIAGSLLWFIFTLNSDARVGKAESLNRFKAFTRHAAESLQKSYSNNTTTDIHFLRQTCLNNRPYMQAILIRSGSKTLFSWPEQTEFFAHTKNNIVIENLPPFLTGVQISIPTVQEMHPVVVHAVLQTLSIQNILDRGKTVFFLILILSLLTLILLIFSYTDSESKKIIKKKKTIPVYQESVQMHQKMAQSVPRPMQQRRKPVSLDTQIAELNNLHIYNEDTADSKTANEEQKNGTIQEMNTNSVSLQGNVDIEAEEYGVFQNTIMKEAAADQNITVQEKLQEAASSAEEIPPPYVQKRNASGWDNTSETQLYQHLEAAITESSATDEDVTLILVRCNGIPIDMTVADQITASLDCFHKMLPFDTNTLGVILYNTSLDKAMQLTESIYKNIYALADDKCTEHFCPVVLGVTTRAGRLIPAYRMIEEAAAALEKASQDDTDPIVAFRANPEKYRRCLAQLS